MVRGRSPTSRTVRTSRRLTRAADSSIQCGGRAGQNVRSRPDAPIGTARRDE